MELRNNNYGAITEEEFLAMGDSAKAEYCNGEIIHMQAASPKHERIRRKIEAEFADLQFDVIEIFKNDSTDYMPNILK